MNNHVEGSHGNWLANGGVGNLDCSDGVSPLQGFGVELRCSLFIRL